MDSIRRSRNFEKSKNNDFLTIAIKDNGLEIPKNELELVFDQFMQSSITKTGAGGRGIQLAIAQGIIEGHDGEIWAETNSEGGTIIKFKLPLQ